MTNDDEDYTEKDLRYHDEISIKLKRFEWERIDDMCGSMIAIHDEMPDKDKQNEDEMEDNEVIQTIQRQIRPYWRYCGNCHKTLQECQCR